MSSFGPACRATAGPTLAGLIAIQFSIPALFTPETPEAGSAVTNAIAKHVFEETAAIVPQLIT